MAWNLMDQAMEKMKQIAHFAEDIGGNGVTVQFKPGKIDTGKTAGTVMKKAMEDVKKSRNRHIKFTKDSEVMKHGGMVINLDLTIQQEQYQAEELNDMAEVKDCNATFRFRGLRPISKHTVVSWVCQRSYRPVRILSDIS